MNLIKMQSPKHDTIENLMQSKIQLFLGAQSPIHVFLVSYGEKCILITHSSTTSYIIYEINIGMLTK